MKNIVLLGAPGAGKGTQSKFLEAEFSLQKVDTGNPIREQIKLKTEIGSLAESFVRAGKLIPDDVVIGLVVSEAKKLINHNQHFLLDGFPRNISQALSLEANEINIDHVVEIVVDLDDLVERIVGRYICSNKSCGAIFHRKFNPPTTPNICSACGSELYQRDDDNESLVRSRLNTYSEETMPLSDFYKQRGKLLQVNGNQSMDAVFADIKTKVAGK